MNAPIQSAEGTDPLAALGQISNGLPQQPQAADVAEGVMDGLKQMLGSASAIATAVPALSELMRDVRDRCVKALLIAQNTSPVQ